MPPQRLMAHFFPVSTTHGTFRTSSISDRGKPFLEYLLSLQRFARLVSEMPIFFLA